MECTPMVDFCLSKVVPWRHEERSDIDGGVGVGDEGVSGHEAEFGDDKTYGNRSRTACFSRPDL